LNVHRRLDKDFDEHSALGPTTPKTWIDTWNGTGGSARLVAQYSGFHQRTGLEA
jgi:hypothetical protein